MAELTGRELDAAVAEMMGWRWLSFVGRPVRSTPSYPKECRVRQEFPPESQLSQRWLDYLAELKAAPSVGDEPLAYCYESSMGPHQKPPWTTDIDAAWQVVEKMQERGFWCEVKSPFSKEYPDWHAGFTRHMETGWNGRPDHRGSGTTAPEAICRAALAVMEKPDGD